MPLPPYIGYSESKDNLYQPVFAKQPGSVASPTASLHFTTSLLDLLKSNNVTLDYITLHV
jgi:S-adenosylmethionine:tRNA ribosyltransferase-isomerase